MSQHPTTFAGEAPGDGGVGWDDMATLHARDGGGVLHGFRVIRKGTLAALVRQVAAMAPDERVNYMIEKAGDRQYQADEIMMLARRSDLPGRTAG